MKPEYNYKEDKMRLKPQNNTVFMDNTKAYPISKQLTMADFLRKFNYYFTGSDLEKVINVERTWKLSLVHLKITTENGVYKNNLRITCGASKRVKPAFDKKIPAYETVQAFMKDFNETTKNEIRIFEAYKKSVKKKEKEFESLLSTTNKINKKYPEMFL